MPDTAFHPVVHIARTTGKHQLRINLIMMHHPLRHALLPAAIVLATAIQAQTITENYIELTVSDTMSMKVKRITYAYTPQNAEMYSDATYEGNEDWEKTQKKIQKEAEEKAEKLKGKLTKAGFKLTDEATGYTDYSISSYEDESEASSVAIELANEAELKRLVAFLRTEGKGDGHVSSWDYEPTAGTEVELMQRLFKHAEEQARTVATLGGRKLGKLITAHDPTGSTGLSWLDTIMEMAKREMMKHEFGGNADLLRMRERSVTFRFALID